MHNPYKIPKVCGLFSVMISLMLFVSGCADHSTVVVDDIQQQKLVNATTIHFAKLFDISEGADYKVVHLFGKANSVDTTANFVLYKNKRPLLHIQNAYYIKLPCERIISLSSIYSSMLAELNCVNKIIAIENKDYYTNSQILKEVNSGKIKEVQRNSEIDKEQVLALKPDVIFAFGMGRSSGDFDSKIMESGIPVVISLDHLEKSPLARAEWIKFFAVFVQKEKEAETIFNEVSADYETLTKLAHIYSNKPSVFTELKFGDTWYVPGGKSFMAQLISDANAHYLWMSDTLAGSLPLSFEAVYSKAHEADFWLNVSMCTSKQQMLAQDKRYGDFSAFKKDAIFNNNLHCNALSYSSYWETGMIYPNRILSDLIQIFHPTSVDSLKREMYFYRSIK